MEIGIHMSDDIANYSNKCTYFQTKTLSLPCIVLGLVHLGNSLFYYLIFHRKGDWLHISPGWLCYLSPEVIRCLHSGRSKVDLPFSEKSDVYAFG